MERCIRVKDQSCGSTEVQEGESAGMHKGIKCKGQHGKSAKCLKGKHAEGA